MPGKHPVWRGLATLVVLLWPVAAAADLAPDHIGAPAVLKLHLTGDVPAHCGFAAAPAASADLKSLQAGGSARVGFTLDCNSPFVMRVSSANGGLKLTGDASPARLHTAGFATEINYELALAFGTDLGEVRGACDAHALAGDGGACSLAPASGGLSSGDGIALDQPGSLTLSWAAPAHRLAAGRYQDVINISVEARL